MIGAWIDRIEDGLRFCPTHALPFDEHGDLVSTLFGKRQVSFHSP